MGEERTAALHTLEEFLDYLKKLDLKVTLRVAVDLRRIADRLKKSDDEKVKSEIADTITKEIIKLDPALDAELQLREAYILTDKRYSVDKLMNNPERLLSPSAFDSLSKNSKKDFSLACVQIALNQPTAAAFHLMRTLEEQVKLLYCSFKKTKRLKVLMWGPMTEQLRTKNKPKPTDKLLSHLDGMRIHFRNPTQHPDAFYSLDEAEDLLNQTISAINMIVKELPKSH